MGDVAALEAQIAFVEDAVQTLDDALAAQQQHILCLERQIDRLQQQLKADRLGLQCYRRVRVGGRRLGSVGLGDPLRCGGRLRQRWMERWRCGG